MEPGKEHPSYRVLVEAGEGYYEEKKSRFLAHIAPAKSEEEALAFIESMRKKYYDARHNCTAFILGPDQRMTRCSDDGEPGGTAGKPMLEVLLGAELTDVVCVVTRYFGGTLLGTGGLVKAYTEAVSDGLKNAKIGTMQYGAVAGLRMSYNDVGKIQYLLSSSGIETLESEYGAEVYMQIRIPEDKYFKFVKDLTEVSAGRLQPEIHDEGYYLGI